MIGNKIPSRSFVHTLAANVNNEKLTDDAFRELVRNTLPHVEGGVLASMNRDIPTKRIVLEQPEPIE